MSRLYQIHEFAELAGVTVRALHHYDRLGLLKPSRTNPTRTGAGYRRYSAQDLEKLEQIVALKFLGFPLKQIRAILERSTPELVAALRLQRRALEDRQMLLGRAIRAIGAAEASTQSGQTGAATDPALLKKVIEVLHMQDGIEGMKKYYSTEEAWEKRRRYYEEGPSPEWQALYRDVSAALDADPGSDTAQALAERWLELSIRAAQGDPEVQLDSPTAWMDREHWPAPMKRRIAEFNLEAVSEFIAQVAAASRKKVFQRTGLGTPGPTPAGSRRAGFVVVVASARRSVRRDRGGFDRGSRSRKAANIGGPMASSDRTLQLGRCGSEGRSDAHVGGP